MKIDFAEQMKIRDGKPQLSIPYFGFVPVRGMSCILVMDLSKGTRFVIVPVRGMSCIQTAENLSRGRSVIVPVRGMSCILILDGKAKKSIFGYRPREGYELHQIVGVRLIKNILSYRPREGYELHPYRR